MWMAVAAVEMHSLPVGFPQCCSALMPPSPTDKPQGGFWEWERSTGGCRVPHELQGDLMFSIPWLSMDLQPGCPCQGCPCHCQSSCKKVTMVLEQDCSPSLLSPKISVQLLPSQTLGWLLLVPTRPLFIQSFKRN